MYGLDKHLRQKHRLDNWASMLLGALLLCLQVPDSLAQDQEWRFEGVDRIVAVSDIHGDYDALVATLRQAQVIDKKLAWSGGNTHFVITGDLLDRGPESRRVMDLVMRLEQEAPLAGGRVHQLLGNHEVMNLIGDLRYVSDAEYAAFLGMEKAKERRLWYEHFRSSQPQDRDEGFLQWAFSQRAPPGFFGHRRAFRHDGVYGKWLLEKPMMIVINDTAFVHGGVPPLVAEQGLAGINASLKQELVDFVQLRAQLEEQEVMSPIDRFRDIRATYAARVDAGEFEGENAVAAGKIAALSQSRLHGPAGPTWYRGTAVCNSLIEGDDLNAALQNIAAERVVFGHTPTVTRQVQQRMHGRIVEIDTGMLNSYYGGSGHALVIEDGELQVVNQNSGAWLQPIAHPVRVGHELIAIDEADLASLLMNGVVRASSSDGTTWQLVQIETEDITVSAYFKEISEEEKFVPELAAFKIDRLLGLGMIPVTVLREINGKRGTLQFVPANTITERERVAKGETSDTPCPIDKQLQAMYVFDSLIGNSARNPSSMLYSSEDWLLMLVDHELAFDVEQEWPAYLSETELEIGDQWRARLRELSDDLLQEELGDVLDSRRQQALYQRRDTLVESALGK
jgi:hypothetical protein